MAITRSNVRKRRRRNNSNVSANTSIELPMDLIFDILLNLPVKSLLRFKSVCKTWYALIQNRSFIKRHHTMSKTNPNNNNPTLPSLLVTDFDCETRIYSVWLQSRDKTRHLIYSFKSNRPPRVLGVCDGMLCVTCDSGIIVCNPSTGGPICKIPRFNLSNVEEKGHVFIGFGGLQTQDNSYDYKLFRIIYSSRWDFRSAEVYSMSTGIWREIEVTTGANMNAPPRQLSYVSSYTLPVAINGVFYWRVYIGCLLCVMYFEMSGYVFDMIACPEKRSKGFGVFWKIVNFKGELALVTCRHRHSYYNLFEMWVFSKKERSWTMKLRTEDFPSMNISILGYGRNNNLVMLQDSSDTEEKSLCTYDLESLDIVYYNFTVLDKCHSVYLYTESLLLVQQIQKEGNQMV